TDMRSSKCTPAASSSALSPSGPYEVCSRSGKHRERVDDTALVTNLEVQMIAGCVAGTPTDTDYLPLIDPLAGHGDDRREVGVKGGPAVSVIDNNVITVAAASVTAGKGYCPRGRSEDRSLGVGKQVDVDAQRVRWTEVAGNWTLGRPGKKRSSAG